MSNRTLLDMAVKNRDEMVRLLNGCSAPVGDAVAVKQLTATLIVADAILQLVDTVDSGVNRIVNVLTVSRDRQ